MYGRTVIFGDRLEGSYGNSEGFLRIVARMFAKICGSELIICTPSRHQPPSMLRKGGLERCVYAGAAAARSLDLEPWLIAFEYRRKRPSIEAGVSSHRKGVLIDTDPGREVIVLEAGCQLDLHMLWPCRSVNAFLF